MLHVDTRTILMTNSKQSDRSRDA